MRISFLRLGTWAVSLLVLVVGVLVACKDSSDTPPPAGTAQGQVTFWTARAASCGPITVTIANQSGSVTGEYPVTAPDCGYSGTYTVSLASGTYSATATNCAGQTWNKTIVVAADRCTSVLLPYQGSTGGTTNGGTTNGGTTNGGTTNGSTTNGSTTNGSTTNGSTTNGSTTSGSTTSGSTTSGSTTSGTGNYQISFWKSQNDGTIDVHLEENGVLVNGWATITATHTSAPTTCGTFGTATFSNLPFGKTYTVRASAFGYQPYVGTINTLTSGLYCQHSQIVLTRNTGSTTAGSTTSTTAGSTTSTTTGSTTAGSNTGSVMFWSDNPGLSYPLVVTLDGRVRGAAMHIASLPACGAPGTATYTGLAPGSYSFTAISANNDNSWSGTVQVTANGCLAYRLTTSGGSTTSSTTAGSTTSTTTGSTTSTTAGSTTSTTSSTTTSSTAGSTSSSTTGNLMFWARGSAGALNSGILITLTGVNVARQVISRSYPSQPPCNDAGSVTFVGLPQGSYDFTADGSTPSRGTIYVPAGVCTAVALQGGSLAPGSAMFWASSANSFLSTPVTVDLQRVNSIGEPTRSITALHSSVPNCGATGAATFTNLMPGDYRYMAWPGVTPSSGLLTITTGACTVQQLSVAATGQVAFWVNGNGSNFPTPFSIDVTSATGDPAGGNHLYRSATSVPSCGSASSATISGLLPGTYTWRTSYPEAMPHTGSFTVTANQCTTQLLTYTGPGASTSSGSTTSSTTSGTTSSTTSGTGLGSVVFWNDQSNVPTATVTLIGRTPSYYISTTHTTAPSCGANGAATFSGLPAGTYNYSATAGSLGTITGSVTVASGGCRTQLLRWNTGSTTGGTTGGSSCPSMNQYVSVVSNVTGQNCGSASSRQVTVRNNSTQNLAIRVCVRNSDGTWSSGLNLSVPPNGTTNWYSCTAHSSGAYQILSTPSSTYTLGCAAMQCQ